MGYRGVPEGGAGTDALSMRVQVTEMRLEGGLGTFLVTSGGVDILVATFTAGGIGSEHASFVKPLPVERPAGDIYVHLICALPIAQNDGDSFTARLIYQVMEPRATGEGLVKAGTTLTTLVPLTAANGLAGGDLYIASFTLDAGDATNPIAAGDRLLACQVELAAVTGDTAGFDFVGAHIDTNSDTY